MKSFKEQYFLTEVFKLPEPGFKFPPEWGSFGGHPKHGEVDKYEYQSGRTKNVDRKIIPSSRVLPSLRNNNKKFGMLPDIGVGGNTEWVKLTSLPLPRHITDDYLTDQNKFIIAGYNGSISILIVGNNQNDENKKHVYSLNINGEFIAENLKWLNCKEKILERGINPESFRWYITKGEKIKTPSEIQKKENLLNKRDISRLKIPIDPTGKIDELCKGYEDFIREKYIEMTKLLSSEYKRWLDALKDYQELIVKIYTIQNKGNDDITPEEKESIDHSFDELRKKYFPIGKQEPGRKLFFGSTTYVNAIKKAVNSLITFSEISPEAQIVKRRIEGNTIPGTLFMPSHIEQFKKDFYKVFKPNPD